VRTSHLPHSKSVDEEVRRTEGGCRLAPMPSSGVLEAEQNPGDAVGLLRDVVWPGHVH
jgi:hypothetical protein